MTAQHTPGPWYVCTKHFGAKDKGTPYIRFGSDDRMGFLANMSGEYGGYRDFDRAMADARLIAAAPDMYDELSNTEAYITFLTEGFAWLQKHHANVPQGQSIDQWIENMMMALNARFRGNRAAIAKARGQI